MSPFDADHLTDMDGNPIEDSGGPMPCPFCGRGAAPLVVERCSREDDPDASYHVECVKRGCNGPKADSQVEAAQGWNGRSGSAFSGLYTPKMSDRNATFRPSTLS
jgi:hypothetical protein